MKGPIRRQLGEWTRRLVERGVERILDVAAAFDDRVRRASTRYNALASRLPIPLPRLAFGDDPIEEQVATTPQPERTPGPEPTSRPASPQVAPVQTRSTVRIEQAPPIRIPGRSALRRRRKEDVFALCQQLGLDVSPEQNKATLIERLLAYREQIGGTDASKLQRRAPRPAPLHGKPRIPTRDTLLKHRKARVVDLCRAYGIEVHGDESQRELVDRLLRTVGRRE